MEVIKHRTVLCKLQPDNLLNILLNPEAGGAEALQQVSPTEQLEPNRAYGSVTDELKLEKKINLENKFESWCRSNEYYIGMAHQGSD